MKAPKRIVTLTPHEHRLLISFLIQYRNMLLIDEHHPDICDELIIKLHRNRRSLFR